MLYPILYDRETLMEFSINLLTKVGICSEHAEIIADTLLCAESRGTKSNGIISLNTYIKHIEAGILDPKAEMSLERNNGAVALLDAKNGSGHIAGYKAMASAIDTARVYGIGMVCVKNSNYLGSVSNYYKMALKENMLGVVLTYDQLTGEVKKDTSISETSKTECLFIAINASDFMGYADREVEYNLTGKSEEISVDEEVVNSLNQLAERYGVSKL